MDPQAARGGSGRPRAWSAGAVAAVGVLWLLAVGAAVAQAVLIVVLAGQPEAAQTLVPTDFVGPVATAVLASLGALVVLRSATRTYGWLMLALALGTGVVAVAGMYAVYAVAIRPEAGLPLVTLAVWVQDLWMFNLLLGSLLLPALFPDGTFASPRWRRPVLLTTGVWLALIAAFVVTEREASNWFESVGASPPNPTGLLPIPTAVINTIWLGVVLASIVVGIGSLVTRWRRADRELRLRLKWVLYAFGILLAVGVLGLANTVLEEVAGVDLGLAPVINLLSAVAMLGVVVALGLAVLKHRLYDVDLVINRTIVYGVLTVVVVATYVAVVVGVGALLEIQESLLALVVTGVVAVAFAPLRDRVQAAVNRLMFGQRDDPYVVLAELGRRLARSGAPDTALRRLCETVATSLKLPGAAIELDHDGGWRTAASYGTDVDADADLVVPLHHHGEVVGRLVVAPRSPREPLSDQDRQLLEDIAHQAGALARSVRLLQELQLSRERLVVAREEERRRIRRDLHDGLGPSLAAQTFRMDALLERLPTDPDGAAELVADLKEQNQQVVADIRRLVDELRPAALDQLGLAAALAAHAGQLQHNGGPTVEVEVRPDPLPDLPAAVEVAAYRIAREAVTNVVRHAQASRCEAHVEVDGSTLAVVIADDGVGVEQPVTPGVGLTSMRARAEELGGSLVVTSAEGGTHVRATLPISGWVEPRANGQHGPAATEAGAGHG